MWHFHSVTIFSSVPQYAASLPKPSLRMSRVRMSWNSILKEIISYVLLYSLLSVVYRVLQFLCLCPNSLSLVTWSNLQMVCYLFFCNAKRRKLFYSFTSLLTQQTVFSVSACSAGVILIQHLFVVMFYGKVNNMFKASAHLFIYLFLWLRLILVCFLTCYKSQAKSQISHAVFMHSVS